jgi:hypothetical protein
MQLSPGVRVLSENIIVLVLVKTFAPFTDFRKFIPHSQEPATGRCPYPVESILRSHALFL